MNDVLLPSRRLEIQRLYDKWREEGSRDIIGGVVSDKTFNFIIWLMTTDEGKKIVEEMYKRMQPKISVSTEIEGITFTAHIKWDDLNGKQQRNLIGRPDIAIVKAI